MVKNPPAKAGGTRDMSSIPRSGRSPGGGNGYPLQYFCLENSMDGGAWQAAVHGVAKGWTQLSTSKCLSSPSPLLPSPPPCLPSLAPPPPPSLPHLSLFPFSSPICSCFPTLPILLPVLLTAVSTCGPWHSKGPSLILAKLFPASP